MAVDSYRICFRDYIPVLMILLLITTRLPIFHPSLLCGDITMVTHPAKILNKTGNLKSTDMLLPAQALQPNGDSIHNPFALNYFGPILLFAAGIKIFGETDKTFFIVQTIFWCWLCFLILRRLKSAPLGLLAFGAFIIFGTFDGSTYNTPTQLPIICLYVIFWRAWESERSKKQLIFYGLIFGLGLTFRPETIFLLVFYSASLFFKKRKKLAGLVLCVSTATTYLALEKLRLILGGIHSSDHAFYNIGTDILAPGWGVMNVDKILPLSEFLLNPEIRSKLVMKLIHGANRIFILRPQLVNRNDFWLLIVALFSLFFNVKSKRLYAQLLLLFLCQALLNCLLNDVHRYYDYVFILLGIQFFEDYFPHYICSKEVIKKVSFYPVLLGLLIILIGQNIRQDWGWSNYFNKIETTYRNKLKSVVEAVSSEDFILSNNGGDLMWYGDAKKVVFAPQTEFTMSRIILKYPKAKIVYFTSVPQGIFEGLKPIKNYKRIEIEKDIILLSPP